MNFAKDFYNLDQLLGCYFHQSWAYAFVWDGIWKDLNWEIVTRQYLYEDSAEDIEKTRQQLKKLLALNLTEQDLKEIIDQSTGSGFSPLKTRRAFLERILEILQEPKPTKKLLVRK